MGHQNLNGYFAIANLFFFVNLDSPVEVLLTYKHISVLLVRYIDQLMITLRSYAPRV